MIIQKHLFNNQGFKLNAVKLERAPLAGNQLRRAEDGKGNPREDRGGMKEQIRNQVE